MFVNPALNKEKQISHIGVDSHFKLLTLTVLLIRLELNVY
jgi:hypothetical protein